MAKAVQQADATSNNISFFISNSFRVSPMYEQTTPNFYTAADNGRINRRTG